MAGNNWTKDDNNRNFRPRSGHRGNVPSSGRNNRGGQQYDRSDNNPNQYRERQQDNSSYNDSTDRRRSYGSSASQSRASDDEKTAYAVNLLLKPVEIGITATNGLWQQNFQGLGAFNHYFGILAPTNRLGYTLPDIWDGYFHITLAKFFTHHAPDQLEERFASFTPSSGDLRYIPDIVFKASRIGVISGANRIGARKDIDFIVLCVDAHYDTDAFYGEVQPLLEEIKVRADTNNWNVTPRNELHVTLRKYSNINFDINKIKIQQFPLEFKCGHLEVKQTRERALDRFKKAKRNTYKWWTGVTEIEGKCSGCGTRTISDNWEGFCLACGKYESIIPIWSTSGGSVARHKSATATTCMNTLTESFQRGNLHEP